MIASISVSSPCPVAPETGTTGQPLSCASRRSASSRKSVSVAPRSSIKSHLPSAITTARPSRAARSAMLKSCFSKGIVESTSSTTTSEKRTARRASAADNFSSLSTTRARFRRPAVSKSFILRSRQRKSTPMESRVIPASGPVSRRSSPRMRLMSVDLPALGRPTTAMRSGFVDIEIAAVLLVVARGSRQLSPLPPQARRSLPAAPRAARRRACPCPRHARPKAAPDRPGPARRPRARRLRPPCPSALLAIEDHRLVRRGARDRRNICRPASRRRARR